LTGRPPFRAETPLETVLQVVHDEPVPPSRFQPKTPRDLETVCLQCLQKDPGRRYASARDLADDLRRFRDGLPVRARPVGAAERLGRWARRRPREAGLAGLGLAAVLLAAGGWAWYVQERAARAVEAADVEQDRARRQAETVRAAHDALHEAARHRGAAQWSA